MVTLREMVALMDRRADATLKDQFGISFSWFRLLVMLSTIEPATQHRLAVCLDHSDAAISRMLGKMTDAGLVEMVIDPAHKRKHVVTLTQKGRDLVTDGTRVLGDALEAEIPKTKVDIERYVAMTLAITAALRERN